MATRLYLVANHAPAATPGFDAGWPDTSQMVRRLLATFKEATTELRSGTLSGVAGNYALAAQLHSPPLLGAQTISGTITITSRGRELAGTDNINKRARALRVYGQDGTLRGTLDAWAATASTTELSTTLSGQVHATNGSITSVNAQDGDYIVVELGYGESSTGTTPNWELALGGSGTDHANANNDATGTVPWVEFSANLVFAYPPPPEFTRRPDPAWAAAWQAAVR